MDFKWFLRMFQKPSAMVLAQQDLEESRRNYLQYKKAEEHSRNMVRFYSEAITRLEAYTNPKGE
jgi:hypothetical protein